MPTVKMRVYCVIELSALSKLMKIDFNKRIFALGEPALCFRCAFNVL